METWECCRTCLSNESLCAISNDFENKEIFNDVVYLAIGIKIEPNDKLPQLMCTACMKFIKEIYKFRKDAECAQKTLQERLERRQFNVFKPEFIIVKTENKPLNLDDYTDQNNDFNDDDDDIPLRNLQHKSIIDLPNVRNTFEITVTETCIEYDTKTFKQENKQKKTVKRKARSKKDSADGEKSDKEKKGEKEKIECEYCHKILTSKLSMRNHYKIHTGFDFVCEHCGKKFISRRLLLMHCRAKHGYEKTDKCSYCDYKASNAEQVKIHERLHTGEKPYVCSECGASFHRKSSYLQHVAIHLPEKTVQCDSCPARFKSLTLMRIHRSRHRPPARRFVCRLCGRSFARRRNVSRHLCAVHATTPDPAQIHAVKI